MVNETRDRVVVDVIDISRLSASSLMRVYRKKKSGCQVSRIEKIRIRESEKKKKPTNEILRRVNVNSYYFRITLRQINIWDIIYQLKCSYHLVQSSNLSLIFSPQQLLFIYSRMTKKKRSDNCNQHENKNFFLFFISLQTQRNLYIYETE